MQDIIRNIRAGISIGNTLDAFEKDIKISDAPKKTETSWGNPVITQELVDAYIAAGLNIIRIPVTWTGHFGGAPDYTIDGAWLRRVREVVDYAYGRGVYVILNLHHEGWNYPYYENEERACIIMTALWSQLAAEFAGYDEHLIFEGQNEPRKIGTPLEWNGGDEEGWEVVNSTNAAFVKTVRQGTEYNKSRYLMIPGYAANCTVGIRHIDIPDDDRIIISVHAYEPYDFALNTEGRSQWQHDTQMIDSLMTELRERFTGKGIPVIIGEFGAMNKDNEADRAEWVEYYIKAAAKAGIRCIWWDNGLFEGEGERFGLFDRHTYKCGYPKVLEGIQKGIE